MQPMTVCAQFLFMQSSSVCSALRRRATVQVFYAFRLHFLCPAFARLSSFSMTARDPSITRKPTLSRKALCHKNK